MHNYLSENEMIFHILEWSDYKVFFNVGLHVVSIFIIYDKASLSRLNFKTNKTAFAYINKRPVFICTL